MSDGQASQPPAFSVGGKPRQPAGPRPGRLAAYLALWGGWLQRHQRAVRRLQWGIVAIYAVLLIVPTLIELPGLSAHVWNNITLFAQFVFWGIWWPGVLLSMLLFGRLWCGVMCPEGALSEAASRHGLGRAIPRWIRWRGWPFAAFVMTTVYGQLVSVYQYPLPVLLILGGSTAAAIVVGYLYGRNHRVWCRYLCPVNGVFGLLAKLAPMHYAVDARAWAHTRPEDGRTKQVTCAPLVSLPTLDSASPCHMCGRCSGFRDAIELRPRAPASEVIEQGHTATAWDGALTVTGLMGVASGAFLWSASPWFVTLKLTLAQWLITAGVIWPLEMHLPWWLLTDYPQRNDVMTPLDGASVLIFILGTALILSGAIMAPLLAAARILRGRSVWHLTLALLPLAACGVILGLSAQTVTLLHQDGIRMLWVQDARAAALALASLASLWLLWRVAGRYAQGWHRSTATAVASLSLLAGLVPWTLLFWIW